MIDASMLIWPGLIVLGILTVGLLEVGIQTHKDGYTQGYDEGYEDGGWPSMATKENS